ncbi:hypothetical protein EVAR_21530_1 [Eumeta japonica]|uniref:Reverse transcriptase domain-containing protein n=1 Tax=Eumeta variegata TaxID=151549 RepID=A0A4C1UYD6_EUMVA|nr:hypothetical protein EVAR_21530_1 [Eumeta japonica]
MYDLKEHECGLRTDELSVKCLLYADGQVILALSACGLQMVNKMKDAITKRGMKVLESGENTTESDILIESEKVEKVKEFVYFGSLFTNDRHDRDIERRVNAGNKVNEALLAVTNSKNVSRQARLAIRNGVLIPTLMHVNEN